MNKVTNQCDNIHMIIEDYWLHFAVTSLMIK